MSWAKNFHQEAPGMIFETQDRRQYPQMDSLWRMGRIRISKWARPDCQKQPEVDHFFAVRVDHFLSVANTFTKKGSEHLLRALFTEWIEAKLRIVRLAAPVMGVFGPVVDQQQQWRVRHPFHE